MPRFISPQRLMPWFAAFAALGGVLLTAVLETKACPLCSAVSQTFTEEMDSMDVVVIAELLPGAAPASDESSSDEIARFRVRKVIKGAEHVDVDKPIKSVIFGEQKPGASFLIMAVDPPRLAWTTPLSISADGIKYVQRVQTIPADGVRRLRFFMDYLEHQDEMLAGDAYDEFAKAPYEVVKALKPEMDHDQLVEWIKNRDIPSSRRRLYLVMLGICGSESDIPMLESMLKSPDRKSKVGLDALIGCYLILRGSEGMPLIEKLFLANQDSEYPDMYAAIMALRVLGTETDVIPKKRLLEGLRLMLARPEYADLVIPDLARWEDWSQIDRLVELFKKSDEETSWVRVPVINYLRACPKPEAKKHLAELEKLDPKAFKRANTFFPFPVASESDSSS